MSFKSRKRAQQLAGRKITKRDRGQRKEIGRLTRLLSDSQIYASDTKVDLQGSEQMINVLAVVLDSRAHRVLSWLRRMVRIKAEIPAGLLSSMKARNAAPEAAA